MGDCDPLQGRDVSFLSGMCKLISFVDRTRVESALTLAFLVSLAWVCALALLLRTTATHSIDGGSKPPLQHAAPLAPTGSNRVACLLGRRLRKNATLPDLKRKPRADSRPGSGKWLPELVAHCAISLAIAHSLLDQLFLVKASLPQFCAASSSFVAIVIAVVAGPYPDASGLM